MHGGPSQVCVGNLDCIEHLLGVTIIVHKGVLVITVFNDNAYCYGCHTLPNVAANAGVSTRSKGEQIAVASGGGEDLCCFRVRSGLRRRASAVSTGAGRRARCGRERLRWVQSVKAKAGHGQSMSLPEGES